MDVSHSRPHTSSTEPIVHNFDKKLRVSPVQICNSPSEFNKLQRKSPQSVCFNLHSLFRLVCISVHPKHTHHSSWYLFFLGRWEQVWLGSVLKNSLCGPLYAVLLVQVSSILRTDSKLKGRTALCSMDSIQEPQEEEGQMERRQVITN